MTYAGFYIPYVWTLLMLYDRTTAAIHYTTNIGYILTDIDSFFGLIFVVKELGNMFKLLNSLLES